MPTEPTPPAEPRTVVIFREERLNPGERPAKWQVMAIFPEEPGTNDPWTCSCYAHHGQHSSMLTSYRFNTRKPLDLAAVAALRAELERIGYTLDERTRMTAAMDTARWAKLARS